MEQAATVSKTSPWKSPLLFITLSYLWFLSISGFALFFGRPFLSPVALLARAHWLLGLVGLLPYLAYQIAHYKRVQHYHGQILYQVGLCLLGCTFLTVITGVALIWINEGTRTLALAHVMTSFALLILLVSHLALVTRQSLRRVHASMYYKQLLQTLALPVLLGLVGTLILL